MKRVADSHGFTIVETMIVLAVTGLMFMAVAIGWGGKQRSSQYQTALADYRARIQQTVSDVQNGYFPSTTNFKCYGNSTSLTFPAGSGQQGSNNSCIFLGKALQFAVGANPEQWREYTVAGYANSGSSSITAAIPTLAPYLTESPRIGVDLVTQQIKIDGNPNYKGLAFLMDPGTYSDGSLQSGNQTIRIYGITGALSTTPELADNATSGKLLNSANFNATPVTTGAKICLTSTGTNNYGLITVGADGDATDVRADTVTSCP